MKQRIIDLLDKLSPRQLEIVYYAIIGIIRAE